MIIQEPIIVPKDFIYNFEQDIKEKGIDQVRQELKAFKFISDYRFMLMFFPEIFEV